MARQFWLAALVAWVALPLLAPCPAQAQGGALPPEQMAAHVLNRLGYGPKPGDIERVLRMGVPAYIDAQLHPDAIPLPPALTARLAGLDTVNQSAGQSLAAFLDVRAQGKDDDAALKARRRALYARMATQAAEARIARAVDSPRQLEEVMVDFWFNHFNVFVGKGIDRALIASYERDAIRPYAFGAFRDLLGATAKHPAMAVYLDNWLSTSADFVPARGERGARAARGLNENYARELMELHTMGVDGGYTQKDVTELARMLTGWTFAPGELAERDVAFRFEPRRHDHGPKDWLGYHIADRGQGEGEYALDVLAMLPATARHISYQLAQYFVQDNPPPALVERMTGTWMSSGGDIRSVLGTLFASAEFASPAAVGAKFKTPYQFVISAARASAAPVVKIDAMLGALNRLGMPLYGCQTPDGYKNTQDAWLNPDALGRRIAIAATLAGAAPALDAAQLEDTLGAAISPQTRTTVSAGPEKLRPAMLLGSPDFMQH